MGGASGEHSIVGAFGEQGVVGACNGDERDARGKRIKRMYVCKGQRTALFAGHERKKVAETRAANKADE